MRFMGIRRLTSALIASMLTASLTACGGLGRADAKESTGTVSEAQETVTISDAATTTAKADVEVASLDGMASDGVISTADLFTSRDLEQEADLVGATYLSLESGKDVTISEEGVYVLVGDVTDVTVTVEADDAAKVQLVLDGVTITNGDSPAIYVKSADKVFVTTTEGTTSALSVTGSFVADGDTNTDAVIFSKDDLVLNGLGTLNISSTGNGITSKDDLKVTGGTYQISCSADALEANDSIRIAGGSISVSTDKDALHAENDEDDTLGYVYICGGTFSLDAADDAIHATTYVQIDEGTLDLSGGEAIEATYIQINGGDITVSAWDDGLNASYKSGSIGDPVIDIRGGNLKVTMAQGDTDALDSNGYLVVSGGTVDISGQFAFDFDYGSEFTGGTVYVNGEQVSQIVNSMMGGMGGLGKLLGR
ncbi:MAG: carbohydrate-binding domain-containing protein [Atopobiaceae bacterium]|nr:carbohydrate-binding domain-containing protein [Atopobiaceae bacterium]